MEDKRTEIQKSFEAFPGMNCFACAPVGLNPEGLNLVFEETLTGASTRFWFAKKFQSYPGYIHGGLVSGVLDETMAYAGVFKQRCLPFTKTLKIEYRLGVIAEKEYLCEGEIDRVTEGGFFCRGAIRDARGRAVVLGWAEFSIPTRAMIEKMMPKEGMEDFYQWFRPNPSPSQG